MRSTLRTLIPYSVVRCCWPAPVVKAALSSRAELRRRAEPAFGDVPEDQPEDAQRTSPAPVGGFSRGGWGWTPREACGTFGFHSTEAIRNAV